MSPIRQHLTAGRPPKEVQTRQAGDEALSKAVSTETERRNAADDTLKTALSTETNAIT